MCFLAHCLPLSEDSTCFGSRKFGTGCLEYCWAILSKVTNLLQSYLPSFLIKITVHLLTKNLFLLAWLRVVLRKETGYRLTTGFLHWLTDRLATNCATKLKLASLIALLSSLLVLSRFLPYPSKTKQAWIGKSAFWIVSMGRQRKTLICFFILGCCWSHSSMPTKS
jgi:hypothetical protein